MDTDAIFRRGCSTSFYCSCAAFPLDLRGFIFFCLQRISICQDKDWSGATTSTLVATRASQGHAQVKSFKATMNDRLCVWSPSLLKLCASHCSVTYANCSADSTYFQLPPKTINQIATVLSPKLVYSRSLYPTHGQSWHICLRGRSL